jgi:hypothetical protein
MADRRHFCADETSTDEEEDEEDEEDLLMDLSPEEAAALAQYQNSSRYTSKIMFADADDEVGSPPYQLTKPMCKATIPFAA